jgi:succinate-acetate transporter protein/type II secretory ATPase GspE/PulE/Tfp pilus assembly ATPase PilB-like protein
MTTNQTKNISVITADPTALGLFGLAMVTLVASSQKLEITTGTSLLIPWVIFLGAFAQLFACINDSKRNNTFGTTAFGGYSLFWFSVGTTWLIKMGVFGTAFSKEMDSKQLAIAFVGYLVFSLFMTIGSAKVSKVLFAIFIFIDVLFVGLVLSTLGLGNPFSHTIAGIAELIISILSFYGSAASVLNTHLGRTVIPVGTPIITNDSSPDLKESASLRDTGIVPVLGRDILIGKANLSKFTESKEFIPSTKDNEVDFDIETKINSDILEEIPEVVKDTIHTQKIFLVDIVLTALEKNATDIYFDEFQGMSRIRYNINGNFITESTGEKENLVIITEEIFNIATFKNNQNEPIKKGVIEIEVTPGNMIKLSVMILPGINSESIVLNFIKESSCKHSFLEVGMNKDDNEIVKQMIEEGKGFIFVSCSDETLRKNTYYSVLKEISNKKCNIISLEKNINHKQADFIQLELKDLDVPLIEKTLKNIGEFGVDVIALDYEYSSNIIDSLAHFAKHGKLIVLTTSHPSVYETITMVSNTASPESNLTSVINGVIAQRTLMKICQKCNEITTKISDNNDCPACGHSETQKNITLFEVIKLQNEHLSILENKDNYNKFKDILAKQKGSYKNKLLNLIENFDSIPSFNPEKLPSKI